MNIKQLGLFKQKILDGSIEICKGNVTAKQIFDLANKALEEALIIDAVAVPKGTLFCNCLTPELLGRYTELKDVCKCGKTVAK